MKNKVYLLACLAASFVVLASCGKQKSSDNSLSAENQAVADALGDEGQAYAEAVQNLQLLEMYVRQYTTNSTLENLQKMLEQSENCEFDYDEDGLTMEQKLQCMSIKLQMDSVKASVKQIAIDAVQSFRTTVVEKQDYLLENGNEAFPFYAQKGDVLYYSVSLQQTGSVRIINVKSEQTLKTVSVVKNKSGEFSKQDSFPIPNSAIYIIEVLPGKSKYVDLKAELSVKEMDRVGKVKAIEEETVEAKKGDFRAISVKGVNMKNLFEEPRKFTLRGQLKAMFSGTSRALVALQVPTGASDVMYSLRISTNEGDRSQDGKFYDNMCSSYRKIKFLGLPLYESQNGSGLLSTLLGDNQPLREEDAYINMYVFYDAAQAKKFQDGTSASSLKYSVDYSTLGTQSCNGRIPSQGKKTIYLAFENERMRYNNYVWLEAVSAVPTSEYFKKQYTVK